MFLFQLRIGSSCSIITEEVSISFKKRDIEYLERTESETRERERENIIMYFIALKDFRRIIVDKEQ